jgi:hypothetical protein
MTIGMAACPAPRRNGNNARQQRRRSAHRRVADKAPALRSGFRVPARTDTQMRRSEHDDPSEDSVTRTRSPAPGKEHQQPTTDTIRPVGWNQLRPPQSAFFLADDLPPLEVLSDLDVASDLDLLSGFASAAFLSFAAAFL